ncbi:hypothetical protein L218DRAFT_1007450 [Marasmius fiardii PR-910]|nr:hypothetical protein L218DRAFT_1007450 [Marasmius fiardii PR-910]
MVNFRRRFVIFTVSTLITSSLVLLALQGTLDNLFRTHSQDHEIVSLPTYTIWVARSEKQHGSRKLRLLLLLLVPIIHSFSLDNIPSKISVLEPFTVNWTSDPTTDPANITIIVYDTMRSPTCLISQVPHYEVAAKVGELSSGKGQVFLTVPHSGEYILCVFSVSDADAPMSANGQSLFNSTTLIASLVLQTITVTASSSPTTTVTTLNLSQENASQRDTKIITGATLGGFFAIFLVAPAALFWFGRYRIAPVTRYPSKCDVDSEIRAVANFTGVRSDGDYSVRGGGGSQVQAKGLVGVVDSVEGPPLHGDVHGGR